MLEMCVNVVNPSSSRTSRGVTCFSGLRGGDGGPLIYFCACRSYACRHACLSTSIAPVDYDGALLIGSWGVLVYYDDDPLIDSSICVAVSSHDHPYLLSVTCVYALSNP